MKLTKRDPFSGKENTVDLPITQEQLDQYYRGGKLIQHAFPQLNADQREFILTGIPPGKWDAYLGPEEDDNIS
jgi:hypothetical protein